MAQESSKIRWEVLLCHSLLLLLLSHLVSDWSCRRVATVQGWWLRLGWLGAGLGGWGSNYLSNDSERDEADLLENVVFVVVGAVDLQTHLLRSHCEVHSLQFSHRLQLVHLLAWSRILKFKVANSLFVVS